MQRKQEFYNKLIGLKQGNIIITQILRTEKQVGKIWECQCGCGNLFETTTSQLTTKKIKNCPECSKKINKERSIKQLTKHGKHNSRLHSLWQSMISRCTYKGDTNYKFYGARGITVCCEWRNDFMNFYNWAIENSYNDNLSIDRINTDGDYEPLNCRWVAMKEQFSNRRTTQLITVNGVTKTQNEWAELVGLSHTAFSQARKCGKDMEQYTKAALEVGRHKADVWIVEE